MAVRVLTSRGTLGSVLPPLDGGLEPRHGVAVWGGLGRRRLVVQVRFRNVFLDAF